MRKLLLFILLLLFSFTVQAQTVIFLPIIIKDNPMAIPDPILVITDGTTRIDLLGPNSGWKLIDPYWNPQIAQYKAGGSFVNAQLAEGRRLVHKEYDNVVETIPLSLSGLDQNRAMQTAHEALELLRQAGDYWAETYEFSDVWLEVKLACNDCLTGYSRIAKGSIPEITNPFGQPFFSSYDKPVVEGITIILEREPFWRSVRPGEIVGPLFNLIDNPDFELWNFGVADSQPDSWDDIETLWITGQNSRDQSVPKFGNNALKIRVPGSTLAGASKGITQVIDDTKDNTEYTIIAWVRSESVSNGVGRILITYASQLELYRESISHGWTLYTGKITTGVDDTVAIHCEILTTAANTDGTIYVDGLMFLEGDWETEAKNEVLPYLSGSHIVNHWDQAGGIIEAGDINWIDVWDIPGNVDSLIRLEVVNNTEPADFNNQVEQMAAIRIGQRRTNDVLNFQNFYDPIGPADTTGSSDNRITSPNLNADWLTVITREISGRQNSLDNQGRFRVFARLYDPKASGDPSLEARLSYFLGTALVADKILDGETIPIRENWCMVDLTSTKAMVQQQKFTNDPPGSLGYSIQMRRQDATDAGRLDYVLTMPTDGGYLEATINPPLAYQYSLIVDNTASLTISGGQVEKAKWKVDWEVDTGDFLQYVYALKEYKGNLYATAIWYRTVPGIEWDAQVWRKKDGLWEQVFTDDAVPHQFFDMEVYNDTLYLASQPGGVVNGQLWQTVDGLSYSLAYTTTTGATVMEHLAAFNGLLYILNASSNDVETWDGSAGAIVHTQAAAATPLDIKVWNGRLYVNWSGGGNTFLDEYDPTTDTWTVINPGFGAVFRQLEVFNNLLWISGIGQPANGNIVYFYDGSGTITPVPITKSTTTTVLALKAYNGKLYAILQDEETWESSNGLDWEVSPAGIPPNSDDFTNPGSSEIYNGQLYYGGYGVLIGNQQSGRVYSFTDVDTTYKSIDFKGGTFTAPPHKRHRWVFSYDRQNDLNDIDDKALIGIGFVPRYLTLRGKN